MNIIITLIYILITFTKLYASFNVSTNAPFISMYGDLEVEPRVDDLSIQFQYGIPSIILTSTTLNGGVVTTNNSEAVLITSGTAGAVAGLQTKTNLQYCPGHQADAYFTVAFTGAIAAGAKQYIGALDSSNGFGVGFNGTTFGLVVRNNGADTFIPQSSFNGDILNGTGSSVFNYNPTLLNVFHIAYGWLGASVIQFQVMASNGEWITFHTIQYPNSATIPSIANALLPMSAQVYDTNGGNVLQLETASWNMGIVGIQSNIANRLFGVTNTAALSGTSESHVLTIQNQNSFNGQPNKINIQLQRYYATINPSLLTSFIINVRKNAVITGTSFSSVDSSSVVAYSSAGTYTAGTGTLISTQIQNDRGFNTRFINTANNNFLLYPGETLTITVTNPGSGGSAIGGFNWAELF